MQVFEAIELREFPYFITVDVDEGETVRDVLTAINSYKVYLLVDHDSKRIWTYNGPDSSFRLQIFGGILAGMMRQQLRLFYKIYPLNAYMPEDSMFQEILDKPLGPGRAECIKKSDFPKPTANITIGDVLIHNPKLASAIENIEKVPHSKEFKRIFVIIGGIIYSEEEIIETYLKEEKSSLKLMKMGRLNNGFTFFEDRNYTTRLIVKDRLIQGIELFVKQDDDAPILQIKTPIIEEEKLSKVGKLDDLIDAFEIPETLPDEVIEESKPPDSTNKDL